MGIGRCEITHYSVHAKQSCTILLQLIVGFLEADFPSAMAFLSTISIPETLLIPNTPDSPDLLCYVEKHFSKV